MFHQAAYSRSLLPSRKLVLVSAAILAILMAPKSGEAQNVLFAGERHDITPAETNCLEIETISPDFAVLPVATAECDNTNGEATVEAGDEHARITVEAVASSVFQYAFVIEEEGDPSEASFVPINVVTDVDWAGLLGNSHVFELRGSASLDIFLQLRQDPAPDAHMGGERGTVLVRQSILGATHGGIAGCLTIPTDPVSAGVMAISCTVAAVQRLRGTGSRVSLDAVVEVGRTYNLELVVTARAESSASVKDFGAFVGRLIVPPGPVLKWSKMSVTAGTDPAALVADLQDQIDQLREDLENHTHNYQTGRGVGHNNTQAISSPAIIPGDAAQGQTANQLRSGPVTSR